MSLPYTAMSEEIEYLPDPLTEEQHKALDAAVLEAFGESPFVAPVLIQEIVKHPHVKVKLDIRYRNNDAARILLQNNPWLTGALEDAWKIKSFRKIRNLAILKRRPMIRRSLMTAVQLGFTAPYHGSAVDGFYEYLINNDKLFHRHHQSYCGKFCSVVQSSGTGKSRLMIEMARKDILILYINLRATGDTGYPYRDPFPETVLTEVPYSEREYGAECCAFFAAVFAALTDHFRPIIESGCQEPKEIIQDWNDVMCEVESLERLYFFARVRTHYVKLCSSMLAEEATATTSKDLLPGEKTVFATCETMLRQLKPLFKDSPDNHPQLLVALDEAHTLDEGNSSHSFRPSTIVCRALRATTVHSPMRWSHHTPVWVAFVSTTGIIAEFSASQLNDNSVSVPVDKRGQELFLPFTELGWDQLADDLTSISAMGAANAEHIVRFGRPLWSSLHDAGDCIEQVAKLAAFKLRGAYDFKPDEVQVLAVLGQRFALEISFDHRDSVASVETAVASHLRICTRTTIGRVRRYTSYPSEPFLSCLAANILHAVHLMGCLGTLCSGVAKGMIKIGQPGELAGRLLWLLAKDLYVRTRFTLGWSVSDKHGELFDCKRIPVVDFFKWVFGDSFWSSEEMTGAEQAFKRAYVNFSHWVSMTENVSDQHAQQPENPELGAGEWTLRHWCRTSAVQCYHGQPWVDKIIPMFFEPEADSDARDADCMSQIFISDTPRRKLENDMAFVDPTGDCIECPSHHPYIAILCELDASKPALSAKFLQRGENICLRIEAKAVDKATFAFFKELPSLPVQALRDFAVMSSVPERPLVERMRSKMMYGLTRKAGSMRWEDQGNTSGS